jgi:aconitate hydratase
VEQGDELSLDDIHRRLRAEELTVRNRTRDREFRVRHGLGRREREILLAGGLINHLRGSLPGGVEDPSGS